MGTPESEITDETVKGSWWSTAEHELFVQAYKNHGKNWRKIAEEVGSRNVSQVRSHAQKYFMKLKRRSLREQAKLLGLKHIPREPKEISTLLSLPQPRSQESLAYENYLMRNYIQTIANVNLAFAQDFKQLFAGETLGEEFGRSVQPQFQYYTNFPNAYQ